MPKALEIADSLVLAIPAHKDVPEEQKEDAVRKMKDSMSALRAERANMEQLLAAKTVSTTHCGDAAALLLQLNMAMRNWKELKALYTSVVVSD